MIIYQANFFENPWEPILAVSAVNMFNLKTVCSPARLEFYSDVDTLI